MVWSTTNQLQRSIKDSTQKYNQTHQKIREQSGYNTNDTKAYLMKQGNGPSPFVGLCERTNGSELARNIPSQHIPKGPSRNALVDKPFKGHLQERAYCFHVPSSDTAQIQSRKKLQVSCRSLHSSGEWKHESLTQLFSSKTCT